MSDIFDKAIIEKRNILNAVRSNSMTLQELRFFSIYLSKINPWDKSTRVVRFPLDDFRRIMGLGSGENTTHFRYTIRHILQQIVEVPNEKGTGYTAFQLFKRAKIEKNENDEWYVEFDAHDDALPLMFDFKSRYFKYELWNALRLKSPNQVRMYEILKQYESLGKRELTVTELRELLGIGKNEYSGRTGWSDFKKKVLDSCQQALKENTDISYTYERSKTGKGGKWLSIVFHIKRNEEYIDQLTLDEFIAQQPKPEPLALGTMGEDGEFIGQTTLFEDMQEQEQDELTDLLGNDFDNADIDYIRQIIADSGCDMSLVRTAHTKYTLYKNKGKIKNPKGDLGYLSKILNQLIADTKKQEQRKPSYDLDKWRELAVNFDPNSISFDDTEGM